jgi:glutamyl-tRNA synthetase
LYSWAFARHHKGDFILRIEDTDLERSTPEAVQAIMDGMHWLQLDYDEGPFFQMQRMERYKAVISEMLAQGSAYLCYSTPAEVEAMREAMRARGEKPRYDGTWRPEPGKQLGVPPADVKPVIRFRNPQEGDVTWQDMVKGSITISNRELDDLIIARPDGTPTYNFCVVVDDWDMKITHVIRGDDHINNTPRQINILKALGGELPVYGHLPMILGPDGEKLSKRHGAVSVTLYDEAGFLPDAMVNYLARLGWSHGDDELFSREQLVEWFDADHLSKSAAQFNPEKLAWVNAHYMKQLPIETLCEQTLPHLTALGFDLAQGPALADVLRLVLERANTLVALAQEAALFYRTPENVAEKLAPLMDETVAKAISDFAQQLATVEWSKEAIAALIKTTLTAHGLKMPKLAMPLRVLLTGETQTPSVDALMTLMGRERVVSRLTAA